MAKGHKGEEDEGKEQRELIQLLALHVQKGNAALFNNRVLDTSGRRTKCSWTRRQNRVKLGVGVSDRPLALPLHCRHEGKCEVSSWERIWGMHACVIVCMTYVYFT